MNSVLQPEPWHMTSKAGNNASCVLYIMYVGFLLFPNVKPKLIKNCFEKQNYHWSCQILLHWHKLLQKS